MQTAQFEIRSNGFFAELAGKVSVQLRAALNRMALQARINKERRQLAEMPEYLLKDMGVTRAQAMDEAKQRGIPASR